MSLGGLSDSVNSDKDIIKLLDEKEADEKLSKEQKEVLKLMTANREQMQYKTALASTMEAIKSGKSVQPKKLRKEPDNG
jgi:hypothetical protein